MPVATAPARFAYVDAKRQIPRDAGGGSGRGPFSELAAGRLKRGDPIVRTIYDEDKPAFRVTLDDWSAQVSTQLSPTAGYGVPVNAITMARGGDPETSGAHLVHARRHQHRPRHGIGGPRAGRVSQPHYRRHAVVARFARSWSFQLFVHRSLENLEDRGEKQNLLCRRQVGLVFLPLTSKTSSSCEGSVRTTTAVRYCSVALLRCSRAWGIPRR